MEVRTPFCLIQLNVKLTLSGIAYIIFFVMLIREEGRKGEGREKMDKGGMEGRMEEGRELCRYCFYSRVEGLIFRIFAPNG